MCAPDISSETGWTPKNPFNTALGNVERGGERIPWRIWASFPYNLGGPGFLWLHKGYGGTFYELNPSWPAQIKEPLVKDKQMARLDDDSRSKVSGYNQNGLVREIATRLGRSSFRPFGIT